MTNHKPSSDVSIAKCISPLTGVHDIYESEIFSTMNHPSFVGLKTEKLPSKHGEHSRIRIFGTIDQDVVDTHDNPHMEDNKVLYKKGSYDFITIQKEPESWSGWI